MADPISIAASAAGLLSLGIESCKLIVHYWQEVRGFDDKIDSIALQADGLLSTLQQINTLLSQADGIHPKIAADIKAKVLQNEVWIKKVHERVMLWSRSAQQNDHLGNRLRATAKKAVFPFHKESLTGTMDILQGLQMNLHTALLSLQIQHVSALNEQKDLIQRMESLFLAKMGESNADMGRMELSIRNIASTIQEPPSISRPYVRETHPGCICYRALRMSRPCPQHNRSKGTTVFTKSYSVASVWLGVFVEARITIRNRANRVSICPDLAFHAIVPYNSPAFAVLVCGDRSIKVIRDLQELFDAGRASPFDRLSDGTTLLHVACHNRGHYDTVTFNHITKYLVDANCPIHEPDVDNCDPIAMLDDSSDMSHLIHLGAIVTDRLLDMMKYGPNIPLLKRAWYRDKEGFLVSDIANAVLSRSEQELKCILKVERLRHDELNIQMLFSLSLDWASGIRILHSATNTIPEPRALCEAMRCDLCDTADVLIKLAVPFDSDDIGESKSAEMEHLLIKALADRGERLRMLARTILPDHVQRELGAQKDCLPDEKAENMCMELEAHGVFIDPSLRYSNKRLVYHASNLGVNQMKLLYQAGFRDIDAPDNNGYTPVMKCIMFSLGSATISQILDRALWLVEKGASLEFPAGPEKVPPCHSIALNVTSAMVWCPFYTGPNLHDYFSLSASNHAFFKAVLEAKKRVRTSCFCSVIGCSPLSISLRFAIDMLIGLENDSFREYFANKRRHIVEAIITEGQNVPTSSYDVIRLLTFTDLELTHTCSQLSTTWEFVEMTSFDDEDAAEIHDEERLLLDEFETLVAELQSEYETLGLSLWEYIQTHWCDRMREHLLSHGETVTADFMCCILGQKVSEISSD
ncbi:hypothetical protein BJX99DRAFT_269908 [Aspergillus californicus]